MGNSGSCSDDVINDGNISSYVSTDNDTCPADQCIIDDNGVCGNPPLTMHAYIVPVIICIITLVGLIGNSIVVFVIFYQGQLKTVTNYYIVNLAITDLAFLIVCAPFTAAVYATTDWVFGRFMCKFVFFLQQVSVDLYISRNRHLLVRNKFFHTFK